MIRKAFALVLSVFICCSLYAVDKITYAVEGACSGVVSALVSQSTDPKVSLQGVAFSQESPTVMNVSFVRSDVSTYHSSLRFFAGPDRSAYLDSIWMAVAELLSDAEPFFFDEIAEGDVVLDGGVSFIYADGGLSVEVSLLVTGAAVGNGVVIEGDLSVSVENGTATIISDGISIDGTLYTFPDLSFVLPELGGING